MPDIAMCEGNGCDKKEKCYRFKATPSQWQSYSDFTPEEKGGCEYFIKFQK